MISGSWYLPARQNRPISITHVECGEYASQLAQNKVCQTEVILIDDFHVQSVPMRGALSAVG